jgi:hypothetical protein
VARSFWTKAAPITSQEAAPQTIPADLLTNPALCILTAHWALLSGNGMVPPGPMFEHGALDSDPMERVVYHVVPVFGGRLEDVRVCSAPLSLHSS